MDLHEYQGKELFASVGLPVPRGSVAGTPEEAERVAAELGGRVVVKAQVHIGGRGKAGGVKLADTPAQAREVAEQIIGMDIRGHQVRQVLVEEASEIARELYAALVLDRGEKKVLAMLSGIGGMEIEQVAHDHPEALARVWIDPLAGWSDYHGRRLCFGAGLGADMVRPIGDVFARLWDAFVRFEATLVEVNPLILTADGRLVALDAKFSVDNNSLYRHQDIAAMRDVAAADPQEQMAAERGVTYVKLDGDIGVLGNGAGLVMSTLDVVADAGGAPANFLDVGGGAKADEIVSALEVITSDPKVKVIFFNIFGGITRCDEVARGVLTAIERMGIDMPIVVRLDGTNDVEGREIIETAHVSTLHVEATMLEAAHRAVALAAGMER
ncbi:MAG TPA: ADP-forming succinate--CoA ligase subunit beta [Thermoleophilia bacterium]|nr:ADP-forming succinate--CoA ligase subunit beta [Thermoleophilia bacterium]